MSNMLLELGAPVAQLHDEISNRITGRIACSKGACRVIAQVARSCKGDHLEIGTLFGGTAILAALVKGSGIVHAVDPMDKYYGKRLDPQTKIAPTVEVFNENLKMFGLEERVCLHQMKSQEFVYNHMYDTALIDGDHSREVAMADWLNVKEVTRKYVIFDNVDVNFHGVVEVFRQACNTEGWRPVFVHNGLGVVERYT